MMSAMPSNSMTGFDADQPKPLWQLQRLRHATQFRTASGGALRHALHRMSDGVRAAQCGTANRRRSRLNRVIGQCGPFMV